jgi:hypothetical protein
MQNCADNIDNRYFSEDIIFLLTVLLVCFIPMAINVIERLVVVKVKYNILKDI